MKLKTMRVRRSRPSTLALALALLLTMLCVYLASLPAAPQPEAEADAADAQAAASADVRMEGLSASFDCAGRYDDELEARIAAANCVQDGGAGLVLSENGRWAVVYGITASEADENAFTRSAPGLTLRISGSAGEIAAVSDAVNFLHAQATETAGLAAMLDAGDADGAAVRSLLNVYRTQGQKAHEALSAIQTPIPVTSRLSAAVQDALVSLDLAIGRTDAGSLRRIHAAACVQWIAMLQEFSAM